MKKRLSLILAIAIAASMLPGFMVANAAGFTTLTNDFTATESNAIDIGGEHGKVFNLNQKDWIDSIFGGTFDAASLDKSRTYLLSFDIKVTDTASAAVITQGAGNNALVYVNATSINSRTFSERAGWTDGAYGLTKIADADFTEWKRVQISIDVVTGAQTIYIDGVPVGSCAADVSEKTYGDETQPYTFANVLVGAAYFTTEGNLSGDIYVDNARLEELQPGVLPARAENFESYSDGQAFASQKVVYDDDAESMVLRAEDTTVNTITSLLGSWSTTGLAYDWVKVAFDLKVDAGAQATVAFNGANYDSAFKVSATELLTSPLNPDGTMETPHLWSAGTSTGVTGNYRGWTHFELYHNIRTGEVKVFEEGVLKTTLTAGKTFPTQGVPMWSFTGVQFAPKYNSGAIYIDNVYGYEGNWTFNEADLTVDPVTRNFFVEVPEGIVIADPASQVSFNIAGTPVDAVYVGKEGNVYKFDPATALAAASTTYTVNITGIDGLAGGSATFANTASITEVYEDFEGEAGQANIVNLGDDHGNVMKADSNQLNDIFAYDGGVSILGLTTEYKISFDAKVAGTSGVGMLVNSIGGFDVPFQIDAWNMRTKLWSGDGGWTVAGPLAKPGIRGDFTNWNHFDVVTNVATGFQKIYLNGELVLIEQAEETNATYKSGTVLVRWASSGVTSYIDNVRIVVSPIGTDVADNFYFGNVKVSGNTVTFAYANPADTAVTGKMILVGYDAEGAIKYITTGDASLAKGEVLSESVTCDSGYYDSTQVASTAVFFWDGINTMKPLAEAAR